MFHGRYIPNHDRMLQTYPGADGLKTGYIDASGCNLVTSAVRGDVRLIGVVMGASNGAERDTHMAALLDAGFERMGVPVSREPPRLRCAALVARPPPRRCRRLPCPARAVRGSPAPAPVRRCAMPRRPEPSRAESAAAPVGSPAAQPLRAAAAHAGTRRRHTTARPQTGCQSTADAGRFGGLALQGPASLRIFSLLSAR